MDTDRANTRIVPELITQYELLHKSSKGYGNGATYFGMISEIINNNYYDTVIDYGCGKGSLTKKLYAHNISCVGYDPAIPEYSEPPEQPADMVVCNDVMEHLTLDTYEEVLKHIGELTKHCVFFNISCRPAIHKLPNGQNCHTLVKEWEWWLAEIKTVLGRYGFFEVLSEYRPGNKNLILVISKKKLDL